MKLHAVAPGGPPEGQCKVDQEIVSDTALDDPLPYDVWEKTTRWVICAESFTLPYGVIVGKWLEVTI